jgi:hypothetical protein
MADWSRLVEASRWSRKQLQPYRESRRYALEQFVGAWRTDAGRKPVPANMLALTVRTYLRNLAARSPAAQVRAHRRELRPKAKSFEVALTQLLREIDAESAIRRCVFDAIFSVGVAKVGITESTRAESEGWLHDSGQPFLDSIDLDDLLIDMDAPRWEAMRYVGNRYRLPVDVARASRLFRKGDPVPDWISDRNEQGDSRVSAVSTESGSFDERKPEPTVELWDIWVPRRKAVLTFRAGANGDIDGDPVRTVDWDGPEEGPYVDLTFGEMAGSPMPVPPISEILDSCDLLNRLWRKMGRQADRQKTITLVAAGADEDGNRIVQTDDGDTVRVDRPEATREARFGGVDAQTLGFAVQVRDLVSYLAGNLDAMAGLGSSAETLGQEEIIKSSSSQKIQDMQASTYRFAKRILKSLAAWCWYDPRREWTVSKPLGNSGITVESRFSPADREESEFVEIELDVRPTSMQDASNDQRLRALTTTFRDFVMPMQPALQAQGLDVDLTGFLKNVADLTNVPEIAEMVVPSGSPPQDPDSMASEASGRPSGEGPGKPSVTRREYVRRSVPSGGTRSARDQVMATAMMGKGVTPQQQAMMGRSPA